MAYTALYRKYRPNNFKSVAGQTSIVEMLKKSIINNKVSHAYLFCGPRGTGKTSIAKIFAHAVNCVDFKDDICGKCEICELLTKNDSDIIEIDAASNNGVDEIRILRENVKLLPSFCKYKIYIIDEVHMLSNGAFNALLKTLEEPPSHVIFILATTEPNKIPLTILSRCQRYDFGRISNEAIIDRLLYICSEENRKIDVKVLEKIAYNSDGGLRDAINLLDQLFALDDEVINIDSVNQLSGNISKNEIVELFKTIMLNDYKKLLEFSDKMAFNVCNYREIVDSMLILLRDLSIKDEIVDYFDEDYLKEISNIKLSKEIIVDVTKCINELSKEFKNSNNQKILFEIYMIKLSSIIKTKNVNDRKVINNVEDSYDTQKEIYISQTKENISEMENSVVIENNPELEVIKSDSTSISNIKNIRINNLFCNANKDELMFINKNFDKINDCISNKKYNSVANLLLDGKVVAASKDYLLFVFDNISNVNNFENNYKVIESLLEEIFDKAYKVVCVLNNEWDDLKKEYINNKKNNVPYVFIEENEVQLNQNLNYNDFENSALNIFGEDTISVK